MECQYFEERVTEYIDRSLPAQDLARIAEHLHECSNCISLFEDVQSLLVKCKQCRCSTSSWICWTGFS